jgi:ferrous iron transport protein A
MTAAELELGQHATIKEIDFSHPSSRRIIEFGFTPGQHIEIVSKSIFNDPISFSLRGTLIALRKSDACCIKIED